MKAYSDTGIILQIKNFKEADKLVTILSENSGVVELVAKAAGKPLTKSSSSLDLINKVTFSGYVTKSIDLLREIQLVNDFSKLKENLSEISRIFYLLEVMKRVGSISELEADFYPILSEFLEIAEANPDQLAILIPTFELHLLKNTGYQPLLSHCLECGNMESPGNNRIAAFGGDAGYLCERHFDIREMRHLLVEDNVLKIQKFILDQKLTETLRLDYSKELLRRLSSIQQTWIKGILEKELTSLVLIKRIEHNVDKNRS